MKNIKINTLEEHSFFTLKDNHYQWMIYWLKVSGINEIRELSYDTNIFLDQIIEASSHKREAIIVHEFNSEGDLLKTKFTPQEKGLNFEQRNSKLLGLFKEMELSPSPIEISGLDTFHQRIHFELIERNGIYTLEPKGLSWKDGEPYLEEAG